MKNLTKTGLLTATALLAAMNVPLLAFAEEKRVIEEIIVTATKTETSLQDTSIAVSAFDSEMMEDMNYHFLATGEVLNERPMSQNPGSLKEVAKDSGYEGLILRPLSACLLSETEPEKRGWVDRSKLLSTWLQMRSNRYASTE